MGEIDYFLFYFTVLIYRLTVRNDHEPKYRNHTGEEAGPRAYDAVAHCTAVQHYRTTGSMPYRRHCGLGRNARGRGSGDGHCAQHPEYPAAWAHATRVR